MNQIILEIPYQKIVCTFSLSLSLHYYVFLFWLEQTQCAQFGLLLCHWHWCFIYWITFAFEAFFISKMFS